MAKTKKFMGAAALDLSFWGKSAVTTEASTVSDEGAEQFAVSETPKKVRTKKLTLRTAFNDLVVREFKRTKFKADRIEFYLPSEFMGAFRAATFIGGRVELNAQGQKFLDCVEKEIYGALPDFDSNATVDQKDGFTINGKPIDIHMDRKTVARQMDVLSEKMPKEALMQLAEVTLKDKFSPRKIRDAVCGAGNASISRSLVASLLEIAAEVK